LLLKKEKDKRKWAEKYKQESHTFYCLSDATTTLFLFTFPVLVGLLFEEKDIQSMSCEKTRPIYTVPLKILPYTFFLEHKNG